MTAGANEMDDQIKHMVGRFLSWKLPENFSPDAGISFKPMFNENTPHPMRHEPTGTNLFDATQAEAMVRFMVEGAPPSAIKDIADERQRQINVEGWKPEHDDVHVDADLARAAACYAYTAALGLNEIESTAWKAPLKDWPPAYHGGVNILPAFLQALWPWGAAWFKPKGSRRDLVRAAALIVAEIERLDRAALSKASGERE